MEINRLDDVIGAVALQDLTEGLSVVIAPVPGDSTLLGARLPINATEAKDAKYIVTWVQSEMPMPGPLSYPSLTNGFAMRDGGFDQTQSIPFSQTLYLTYPGMQDGKTIPSGMAVVLHGGCEGVYTISSGLFVANTGLVAGAKLEALNVADDTTSAGKLSLTSTEADTVATVVKYDSVKVRLTVKSRAA
jgi:hypothetical protein